MVRATARWGETSGTWWIFLLSSIFRLVSVYRLVLQHRKYYNILSRLTRQSEPVQIKWQGNGQGAWIAYKKIKFLISQYINKKSKKFMNTKC